MNNIIAYKNRKRYAISKPRSGKLLTLVSIRSNTNITDNSVDQVMASNGKNITSTSKTIRDVSIIADFNIVISSLNISRHEILYPRSFTLVYTTYWNNAIATTPSIIRVIISVLVGGFGLSALMLSGFIISSFPNKVFKWWAESFFTLIEIFFIFVCNKKIIDKGWSLTPMWAMPKRVGVITEM